MNPINLRSEFGHEWQVAVHESTARDHGNPWNQVVVCRHGLIYAVGPTTLGVATNQAGDVVRQVREIDGVEIVEESDVGANAIFHLAKIRYVQRVMQPRRTRRPKSAAADGGQRPREQ